MAYLQSLEELKKREQISEELEETLNKIAEFCVQMGGVPELVSFSNETHVFIDCLDFEDGEIIFKSFSLRPNSIKVRWTHKRKRLSEDAELFLKDRTLMVAHKTKMSPQDKVKYFYLDNSGTENTIKGRIHAKALRFSIQKNGKYINLDIED